MLLEFKVNIGTVKAGKGTISIFRDADTDQLIELEKDNISLFEALRKGDIKNTFKNELSMREVCDLNMILHEGIKKCTVQKSVRGCFITYKIEVLS